MLLAVEDGERVYYKIWFFVLKNNSRTWRMRSPVTPEHIEAIRKELGLGEDEQPKC